MNTILKKITAFWRIASAIVVTWLPLSLIAQMLPFPAGYISHDDTISYDYGNLNYLIITADSLRPAFKDFAMSKALKGYEVKIAAVEDIYQTYSNIADSVERIKWYIANEYMCCGKHLQFVLLGGDVNIVPTRFAAPRTVDGAFPYPAETISYYYEYDSLKLIASDLYYVSFYNSFSWDEGNNGKFAEIAERVNINGYVYETAFDNAAPRQYINVSRLPVHNSVEVNNYTAKLFRYERDELKYYSAYNRALFAGCKAFCYKDGMSDTKYWNDSIISHFLTGMNVTTLYDASFTNTNLQSSLANTIGYNLINIDTHGTETGWLMADSITWYDTALADNQTGRAASIITTPACDVADFSASLSLGKTIILNANNNTIAFWGASNLGFGPKPSECSTKPGISRELTGHFYRHLQSDTNKSIGNIIFKSKRDFDNSYLYDEYSPERYLMFTQTLLGDAEITILNTRPNHIQPFDLFMNGGYALMGSFDPNAKYNLMFDCEDNPSEATHTTDYTHLYPITEFPDEDFLYEGPFQIGITKEGYAPWRSDKDYYATVRVQGTEFDGEHLRGQNYLIGSAVDTNYNTGQNSVAAGSDLTLEVGGSLTITDKFTCPVGSTMTIKPLETITY